VTTSADQTPEEIAAHFAGPVVVAWEWLEAVIRDSDFRRAWPLSDAELRLARAQAWIWNNRYERDIRGHDLDALAAALAEVRHTKRHGPTGTSTRWERRAGPAPLGVIPGWPPEFPIGTAVQE
jgi:hypothetical protein